jgi:hypothetical protein
MVSPKVGSIWCPDKGSVMNGTHVFYEYRRRPSSSYSKKPRISEDEDRESVNRRTR